MLGWLFSLVWGAFVLAMIYVATGHSTLCVAIWHVTFNMMVSTPDTEIFAAVVNGVVILWGVISSRLYVRQRTDSFDV